MNKIIKFRVNGEDIIKAGILINDLFYKGENSLIILENGIETTYLIKSIEIISLVNEK